ncbi:hypothetical protein E6O75_ATG06808 [Venturia nashicola]|uniref:Uncharacterized protein n=1 Tax=Venturia nashicola TaxID=86259 RepID=A0A4Z1NTH2_9PEZI|nr:hypothetical protein E6O75_ATG06808 [Venturia nashicola]
MASEQLNEKTSGSEGQQQINIDNNEAVISDNPAKIYGEFARNHTAMIHQYKEEEEETDEPKKTSRYQSRRPRFLDLDFLCQGSRAL